jgi:starvation-inducible DNA-binding protein
MEHLNLIGLDTQKSRQLAEKLNLLLADYSVFYQNSRGYHWNIKGEKFFELHIKFQELYNDLFVKIDDIAERILTLGLTPEHNYTAYILVSEIRESGKVSDGKQAVGEILNTLKTLITRQRDIMELAEAISDEGTSSLMSDYIREQEKMVWMYTSYLNAGR